MNIIFFTESMVTAGGVVRVISRWANYFSERGSNVSIVSMKEGTPYFSLDKLISFEIINVRVRYKILKIFSIFTNAIRIYKYLNNKPSSNIVINKSLYIEPLFCLKILGLLRRHKLVYLHHGGLSSFQKFYTRNPFILHRIPMIFWTFDKVVVLFDDAPTSFAKPRMSDKLFFIPNSVAVSKDVTDYSKKENTVLFVGRITKQKGLHVLLQAWAKLGPEKSGWRLEIVGDGNARAQCELLAQKLCLKDCRFHGEFSEVSQFYKKAKIFVTPSFADGFGMTTVEAMAEGCAVISTDTVGGRFLLGQISGPIVPINDDTALADAMSMLINSEKVQQKLSKQGIALAKQFSEADLASKWNAVLEE